MFGNSTTSCSGKSGIVGGSVETWSDEPDVVDCAQVDPGTHIIPTIHTAHARLMAFIRAPLPSLSISTDLTAAA